MVWWGHIGQCQTLVTLGDAAGTQAGSGPWPRDDGDQTTGEKEDIDLSLDFYIVSMNNLTMKLREQFRLQ